MSGTASPSPGIIPARAGFTRLYQVGHKRGPDHPRSRGVYRLPLPANVTNDGSSPLARGLRDWPYCNNQIYRIIPARAGFTLGRRSRRR